MKSAAPSLAELLSLSGAEALAEGFSRTLVELCASDDRALASALRGAARAVSRATADGHTCLRLAELAPDGDAGPLRQKLLASGLVARGGGAAEGSRSAPGARGESGPPADLARRPLVLDDGDRLYLDRHYAAECRVAARLCSFGAVPLAPPAAAQVRRHLADRFGDPVGDRFGEEPPTAGQRNAVERALTQRLAIITGGPGTGKTTTVIEILAFLLAADPGCRILLAAPTGKAAARLRDAVRAGAGELPAPLRDRLPEAGHTVHRLLEHAREDGGRLACDVLVVDEASMLDLTLADRLLATLPATARLILLGDAHQLAAVDAGAVFAELCAGSGPPSTRAVELTHSFRFGHDTPLGRVAMAIRAGQGEVAITALADPAANWVEDNGRELDDPAIDALAAGYAPYAQAVAAGAEPSVLFAAFAGYRVLCALREGPRGVGGLNAVLTRRLREALAAPGDGPWFAGRPVLVTRNEPLLGLFNGDIGIALPAPGGGFRIAFEAAAAASGSRWVSPARLPPHETALAMTVHKAQGSEFERVALVLPAAASPVATRELVYTGITRARRAVAVYAPAAVLRSALATPGVRHSGLADRLAEFARDADPTS